MPSETPPVEPRGELVLRTQAMPRDTNANGDIFGGWIMSQMDIGGALLAKEVARGRVATVRVDAMTFVRPVRVGAAICVHAALARIGRTSLDVHLEVWSRDLLDASAPARELVTTGRFRYVAIDDERRPRPVPDSEAFPRSIYGADADG